MVLDMTSVISWAFLDGNDKHYWPRVDEYQVFDSQSVSYGAVERIP